MLPTYGCHNHGFKAKHKLLPLIKRVNRVSVSVSSLLSVQPVFEGTAFGKCVTFTHHAALN